MTTTPLLDVQQLASDLAGPAVFKNIDLTVQSHQVVGITGPRGSGKRQLLELLSGLRTPTKGQVRFKGDDVTRLTPGKRRRLGFEYSGYIDPMWTRLYFALRNRSVEQRLYHKAKNHGRRLTRRAARDAVEGILLRYGLAPYRRHPPMAMSVGIRARLQIAEMLVADPLLVLWDEPFRSVDPVTIASFQDLFRELIETTGVSFLITDRSGRLRSFFDVNYALDRGALTVEPYPNQQNLAGPVDAGQVFISYSRDDSDAARHFQRLLVAAGARPWIDHQNLDVGSHFDGEIQNAILQSSVLIVLLSASSVDSRWVMDEVAFALERGKRVVPILIADCEIPLILQRVNYLDWRTHFNRSIDKQIACLEPLFTSVGWDHCPVRDAS